MSKLTGKTTLTTDALRRIGEGIVRTFAYHDASLTLLDISPETERLADELCGCGHRCTAIVTDVRNPASVAVVIKRTKEKEGRIDILMNNAGVRRLGSFLDMSGEDRDFHTDINIKGVWNVMKTVLPGMIARKDGRIVMMSSATGDMVADSDETVYVLTKVAVAGLTKLLAVEYAQSGTRINAICPGYVHTLMAESTVRRSNPEDLELALTEMAKIIPMCRLADPLGVGELAAFLVSDESSYSTDTQNVIDGGSTLPEAVSADI